MFRIRLAAIAILIAGAVLGFLVVQSETQKDAMLPPVQFGLDLEGGTHLVYEADTSEIARSETEQAMNALRNVIEQRVNAFGVSEPLVQTETAGFGENQKHRLIVELPGVKDVAAAKDAIGKTPVLEFKLVKEDEQAPQKIATSSATVQTQEGTTTVPVQNTGALEDTDLTGRFLTDAQLQFGGQQGFSNEPVVLVEFNQEGTSMFADITGNNVGRQLAIYLDGRLLSAPVLQEEIPSGQAQISGNFTAEEARELVRNLDLGALPVPITLVTEQTIGAALGEETKEEVSMPASLAL